MGFVVAVSGPIAVGKSAFIGELVQRVSAIRVSTRELIQSLRDVPSERGPLQEAGDALDRETDGGWVAESLYQRMERLDDGIVVVVDSVRIAKQVEHLREMFGDKVRHIHLTGSHDVLVQRFQNRKEHGDPAVQEFATYDEARRNSTEAGIGELEEIADLTLSTDQLLPGELANSAIENLRLVEGR